MTRTTSYTEESGPFGEKKSTGSNGGLPDPVDDEEGRSVYIRAMRGRNSQNRHTHHAPRRRSPRF